MKSKAHEKWMEKLRHFSRLSPQQREELLNRKRAIRQKLEEMKAKLNA